ncbi:MAG: DMT family transporter [Prevotella sp.]|nr:DMT family transporter [Prevotella sp.]MCF0208175.1 DMT family transporter [Bacteroidaceae bacterium]
MSSKRIFYHFLAALVAIVWGVTFVSTKVLLANGLTPAAIFALRFSLAYAVLLLFSHKRILCESLKDELLMAALGMTGGSLYFLTENMALEHTTATNTSLIVCSCPLFATILIYFFFKEQLSKRQMIGGVLAFIGMAVVVLNGQFVLHLSPLGDLLALGACLCWAVYSVVMRLLADRYETSFINRKIFFYGLLTIIPWFIAFPEQIPSLKAMAEPVVVGNLLFLALIASLVCYCLWTVCMKHIGVIEATNYVYLNPIATVVAAYIVLAEQITVWFIAGTVLILLGLYIHNRHT